MPKDPGLLEALFLLWCLCVLAAGLVTALTVTRWGEDSPDEEGYS